MFSHWGRTIVWCLGHSHLTKPSSLSFKSGVGDTVLCDKLAHLNMACTTSNKAKVTQTSKHVKQKHWKNVGLPTVLVAGALAMHVYWSLCKTPMHTSRLTGLAWVKELLAGHPHWFYNMMGMAKQVFPEATPWTANYGDLWVQKSSWPSSCGYVTLVELSRTCRSIFNAVWILYLCMFSHFLFHFGYSFQWTLYNRVFNHILDLHTCGQKVLPIWDHPFFKGCLGTLDGTHIDAFVFDDALHQYCNHKGGISQNVLAACTFDVVLLYSKWLEGKCNSQMYLWWCLSKRFCNSAWLILFGRYWVDDL